MGKMTACSLLAASALVSLGCGNSPSSNGGGDGSGPFDAGSSGTIDAGSDPAAPDAGRDIDTTVRFVAMGDTGEGNATQRAVGEAVAEVCETRGCDFVLLLGDNIYDSGVDSVMDPQWLTKFEGPYENVPANVPFYAVLGNHDYGGDLLGVDTGGMGNEFDKGPLEVEYTDHSDRWVMPDTHYTLKVGNVGFIMLDTNSIMWDETTHGDQRVWYPEAVAEMADMDWVFAAGHHPYLSNGTHGNAGNYESIEVAGVEIPNPLPLLNGDNVKDFFDDVICGTVDIYFSGHDHNRQWIDEPNALCGATMIVSGAGAKTKELPGHGNTTLFEDADKAGFAYITVTGSDLTLEFIDQNGTIDFTQSLSN